MTSNRFSAANRTQGPPKVCKSKNYPVVKNPTNPKTNMCAWGGLGQVMFCSYTLHLQNGGVSADFADEIELAYTFTSEDIWTGQNPTNPAVKPTISYLCSALQFGWTTTAVGWILNEVWFFPFQVIILDTFTPPQIYNTAPQTAHGAHGTVATLQLKLRDRP